MGYRQIELDGEDYNGEEVIRRHCKLPKDADEQSLRTAAQHVVHDEGYELDIAELVIQR